MQQHLRLAAILFADIAELNAAMQRNEALAQAEIRPYQTLIQTTVDNYNGKMLNNYRDGILCIFDNATQALRAAMIIQNILKNERPAVHLRIGLHISNIGPENENVSGDGVNIASGIQSISNENAILFSNEFFQQIKNQPEFTTSLLGSFQFKNVNYPVIVYALSNEGFTVSKKLSAEAKLKLTGSKRQPIMVILLILLAVVVSGSIWWKNNKSNAIKAGENTIAILPFQNLTANKQENEPFCIGFGLELQRKLEWIGGLTTISAHSVEKYRDNELSVQNISRELGGVKFLVKGTVQRNGNRFKVFVSLIDAPAGKQVWAETFPGEMIDVFAQQEKIAREIADHLRVKITPAERPELKKLPSANAGALGHYNEALRFYVKLAYAHHSTWPATLTENYSLNANYRNILTLCDKALQTDPALSDAILLKAKAMLFRHRYFSSGPDVADSIRHLCRQALSASPASQEIFVLLSQLQPAGIKLKPDPVTGLMHGQLLEKALKIKPNNFEVNLELGNYYACQEPDPEKSIHHFKIALRINPLSAWTANIYLDFATPYWNVYDYAVAEYYLKKSIELSVNSSFSGEAMKRLCMIYIQTKKPDSVFRYAGLLLAQGDKNALYYSAEAKCMLQDSCAKACEMYAQVWSSFQYPAKENRWGYALWKSGKKEEGLKHLHEGLITFRKYDSLGLQDFNNYEVAGIYAFLGEKEKAIGVLKNMDQDKGWNMGLLNLVKFDPLFTNLRDDPVFNSIVAGETEKRLRLREKIREQEAEGSL